MDESWFARHPVDVAYDLIGCTFTVARAGEVAGGRVVETEAYAGPLDAASHSARMTYARGIMAGPVGRLYAYRSYGIHVCVNIVAHLPNEAGAVLIRAIEPTDGFAIMQSRRGSVPTMHLLRGPGNVGAALAISLADIGEPVVEGGIARVAGGDSPANIHASPRIGISKAVDAPWRFYDALSPAVSSRRHGVPVTRDDLARLRAALSPVE